MSTKIQIRRDTASAWTTANPALANGEIGYETDTRNIKIGDGTTVWTSLKYQAPYYTGANSGAPNTLFALDVGNSRVGIGTVSPQTSLDIAGQTRLRAGPTYAEPGDNATVLNYDATGGILTVDARSSSGTTNIAFRASTSGTGGERVRIRPSGYVLEANGIVTSNRTTAGQFAVSGDGVYAFGNDLKQYIYGKPGNDGNVAIYTTTSGGTLNDRLNVTSTAVQVKTALTTTNTATIGDTLTVSTGGLTVSAGGLTVNAGSVSVPAGSIAGAALADNGVTVTKLAQVSVPSFLGTPSGTASATNVSALTQAQARTMLGLVPAAYNTVGSPNTAWTNTAINSAVDVNLDLDVTTMTLGVIYRIPILWTKASGSSVTVTARAIVEANETFVFLAGYFLGGAFDVTGINSTTNSNACWFWRNAAWTTGGGTGALVQNVSFVPAYEYTGANTVNIFRLGAISGTPNAINAVALVLRVT